MSNKPPTKPARLCEICGARVTNQNPKVTTCDGPCTEAKKKGRTHKHQMRLEANRESKKRDMSHYLPLYCDGKYAGRAFQG